MTRNLRPQLEGGNQGRRDKRWVFSQSPGNRAELPIIGWNGAEKTLKKEQKQKEKNNISHSQKVVVSFTELVELGRLWATSKIGSKAEGGYPRDQKVCSAIVPDLLHDRHHVRHHLLGISIWLEKVVVEADEHHEEGPVHWWGSLKESIDLVHSSWLHQIHPHTHTQKEFQGRWSNMQHKDHREGDISSKGTE